MLQFNGKVVFEDYSAFVKAKCKSGAVDCVGKAASKKHSLEVVPDTLEEKTVKGEKKQFVLVRCTKCGAEALGEIGEELTADQKKKLERKAKRDAEAEAAEEEADAASESTGKRKRRKRPASLKGKRARKMRLAERTWIAQQLKKDGIDEYPLEDSHPDNYLTESQKRRGKTYTEFPFWASVGEKGFTDEEMAQIESTASTKKQLKPLRRIHRMSVTASNVIDKVIGRDGSKASDVGLSDEAAAALMTLRESFIAACTALKAADVKPSKGVEEVKPAEPKKDSATKASTKKTPLKDAASSGKKAPAKTKAVAKKAPAKKKAVAKKAPAKKKAVAKKAVAKKTAKK